MKIDFNQPVPSIKGEPFENTVVEDGKQVKKVVPLKDFCVNALLDPENSKNAPGTEKNKNGLLAMRIDQSTEPIDITAEELNKIVEVVGKHPMPQVVTCVWAILQK